MSRRLLLLTLSLELLACKDPEDPGDGSTGESSSTGAVDSADATTADVPTTTAGPMTMPMSTACEGDGALGACCDGAHPCDAPGICGPLLGPDAVAFGENCNACLAAADCAMGRLCVPVLDAGDGMMMTMMLPTGQRDCVEPGSVADDAMCPEDDTGDAACASGHCGALDVMGIITLHLCGACDTDADCGPGESCQPPTFDMSNGPAGARCV